MSKCPMCQGRAERAAPHAAMTREYYGVLIKPLRHVAERCGYALGVHGSLGFDIDLIACPWRDGCVGAAYLAEELRKTAAVIIGICEARNADQPSQKPCGRLAWTFYLVHKGMAGPYIDLSVMPKGGVEND